MENITPFSDVIQAFYHYIENDVDFFSYFELTEEESMEVAGQRAEVLLKEATSYLSRKLIVENVFSNIIEVEEENVSEEVDGSETNTNDDPDPDSQDDSKFDEEPAVNTYMAFAEMLTDAEINLLVKTMFLMYLQRDITVLRTFHGVMTSSDLNMYSPANERKTFIEMVEKYESQLKVEISEYQMRDRVTGLFVQVCE